MRTAADVGGALIVGGVILYYVAIGWVAARRERRDLRQALKEVKRRNEEET